MSTAHQITPDLKPKETLVSYFNHLNNTEKSPKNDKRNGTPQQQFTAKRAKTFTVVKPNCANEQIKILPKKRVSSVRLPFREKQIKSNNGKALEVEKIMDSMKKPPAKVSPHEEEKELLSYWYDQNISEVTKYPELLTITEIYNLQKVSKLKFAKMKLEKEKMQRDALARKTHSDCSPNGGFELPPAKCPKTLANTFQNVKKKPIQRQSHNHQARCIKSIESGEFIVSDKDSTIGTLFWGQGYDINPFLDPRDSFTNDNIRVEVDKCQSNDSIVTCYKKKDKRVWEIDMSRYDLSYCKYDKTRKPFETWAEIQEGFSQGTNKNIAAIPDQQTPVHNCKKDKTSAGENGKIAQLPLSQNNKSNEDTAHNEQKHTTNPPKEKKKYLKSFFSKFKHKDSKVAIVKHVQKSQKSNNSCADNTTESVTIETLSSNSSPNKIRWGLFRKSI